MIPSKDIDISIIDVFILLIDDTGPMKDICTATKKSFLSVMNKPILFYQLEFLERQNIKDVHLLIKPDDIEITKLVESYKGNIKIDYIEVKNEGLEIFNLIKNKLTKNNFILIEGDSILSFDLGQCIDYHIDNKNLITLTLQKKEAELKKMQKFREDITEAFGIDHNENNRIVYYCRNKSNDEYLNINKRIFKRFSNFNLYLNYLDGGFYIFNNAIFDIIEFIKTKMENKIKEEDDEKKKEDLKNKLKSLNNLKEGFIPYLIKRTFSKDLNMILIEKFTNKLLKADRVKIGTKLINNEKNIQSEFFYKIYDYPSYFNIIEEIQKPYSDIRPIFFQTKNNIKNYFYNFADKISENLENKKKFNEGISEIEFISADSYIADGIKNIEKQVILNKTIADKNLEIKEGSKVLSCNIGQDSKIGKNCKLKDCIVGKFCEIGDNCDISECIIADYYKTREGVNASQAVLNSENEGLIFKEN